MGCCPFRLAVADLPLVVVDEAVVAGFRLPVAPPDLLADAIASDSESESETVPKTCLLFRILALDDLVNFLAENKDFIVLVSFWSRSKGFIVLFYLAVFLLLCPPLRYRMIFWHWLLAEAELELEDPSILTDWLDFPTRDRILRWKTEKYHIS